MVRCEGGRGVVQVACQVCGSRRDASSHTLLTCANRTVLLLRESCVEHCGTRQLVKRVGYRMENHIKHVQNRG